jgi:geranylgeranyl pyrophosphate synthase
MLPSRAPLRPLLRPSALACGGVRRGLSAATAVQNNEHNRPDITVAFRMAAPSSLTDPFALVQPQLRPLDASIRELVGADHPVLAAAAHHFFERAGKRFRPTLVLLSSAAAGGGQPADQRQVRLAEITEMIHAASLLHDDVIDLADTRRGAKAAHKIYGNKVAVLAGDFLLARSSLLLARMKDTAVVELLATVIEEMVQGEMMQVRATPEQVLDFGHYLDKSYRKTAALMSLSCEASAVLAGHPPVCGLRGG